MSLKVKCLGFIVFRVRVNSEVLKGGGFRGEEPGDLTEALEPRSLKNPFSQRLRVWDPTTPREPFFCRSPPKVLTQVGIILGRASVKCRMPFWGLGFRGSPDLVITWMLVALHAVQGLWFKALDL